MFCNNCGNQLEEGTVFCQNCGTAVNPEGEVQQEYQEPQPEWQAPQQENPVDKVRGLLQQNKGIVGIVGAVAVVIILICLLGGGGGYKKTVKDFMKAFEKSNAKKIVKLTMTKEMQKETFDDADEKKDYIDDMKDELDEVWEELEDEDIKFKWEIKKAESLKKLKKLEDDVEEEWGMEDLDDYRDSREDFFDEYDIDVDKIKDVYAVEVKMTFKGEDDTERQTAIMLVYKYKGDWYIDPYSMSFMY